MKGGEPIQAQVERDQTERLPGRGSGASTATFQFLIRERLLTEGATVTPDGGVG